MRILIFGGTIGLSYAWLLSDKHDVSVYVRPEKQENAYETYSISAQDLRKEKSYAFKFSPNLVTDLTGEYDLIIVTVNRCQLLKSLPILKTNKKMRIYYLCSIIGISRLKLKSILLKKSIY